jgi:hypothetical protein
MQLDDTGNPKILAGNDKDVMPLRLDRGCGAFATRASSLRSSDIFTQTNGTAATIFS